jgi:hypothetical protein
MANYPQFIGAYRQDIFELKPTLCNTPQTVFTPGGRGSRILSLTITNEGQSDVELQMGFADKLQLSGLTIAPGNPAATAPWTLTRAAGNFVSDGWFYAGGMVGLGHDTPHKAMRGDFKITAMTTTVLTFPPKADMGGGANLSLSLWRWRQFWTVKALKRAGFETNAVINGLKLEALAPVEGAYDKAFIITKPLWVRSPQNLEGTGDSLTLNVLGGDY